jgi:hypothetical protein
MMGTYSKLYCFLQYLSQGKYLINCGLPWAKTTLISSNIILHIRDKPTEDDAGEDLTCYVQ